MTQISLSVVSISTILQIPKAWQRSELFGKPCRRVGAFLLTRELGWPQRGGTAVTSGGCHRCLNHICEWNKSSLHFILHFSESNSVSWLSWNSNPISQLKWFAELDLNLKRAEKGAELKRKVATIAPLWPNNTSEIRTRLCIFHHEIVLTTFLRDLKIRLVQ